MTGVQTCALPIYLTAGSDITIESVDSFSYSEAGNSGNGGAIALDAGGNKKNCKTPRNPGGRR